MHSAFNGILIGCMIKQNKLTTRQNRQIYLAKSNGFQYLPDILIAWLHRARQ